MNKLGKKLKKNKWFFRVCLFLFISFFVLVFISFNSTYLINEVLRYILIAFMLLFSKNIIRNLKPLKIKKANKFFSVFFIVYALGCFAFLLVLYGPNEKFKDWLITTAMTTTSHQYFCQWFYSDETIEYVMSNNYMIEPDEDTDASLVDTSGGVNTGEYENEYEEAILDREEGTLYKIIELEVNGQDAYLAVIYDPSTVAVGVTDYVFSSGQYLTTMATNYEASIAINGGRFYDPNYSGDGGTPSGITYSSGELITGSSSTSTKLIGFTEEDVLVLVSDCTVAMAEEMGIRDSVYSTPFLIVNGTPSFVAGNGGWGYAARTAIGQRADGIVLFLVVDTNEFRTSGADMTDLTEIMLNYGAVNAANLDGGTSSAMAVDYTLINDPIDSDLVHKTRPIATMFYAK